MSRSFIHATRSLCPVCGRLVDAKAVAEDGRVFLEKFCPEHGAGRALVSSDAADYRNAHRAIRPGRMQERNAAAVVRGCPEDCGLCPDHEQHVCMPILELTEACDLACPICLADEGGARPAMTLDEVKACVEGLVAAEGRIDVLNLSGGEPTLHPDYRAIVSWLVARPEITAVSVSTNGLSLLADPALLEFHKERSVVVSLQYDGESPAVYARLRGRDLTAEKRALVERMVALDMDFTLIYTIARGVNDDAGNCGAAWRILAGNEQCLSLLFQPLVHAGRLAAANAEDRVTIPDVTRLVEDATLGKIAADEFIPLPCCHARCFSLVHLVRVGERGFVPLRRFVDGGRYADLIRNKSLFGADEESFGEIRDLIFELWADDCGGACGPAADLRREALASIKATVKEMQADAGDPKRMFGRAKRRIKSVYVHHFMDADTFDLTRLRRCCTVYAKPGGRVYPLCAWNNLHRGRFPAARPAAG